MICVIVVYIKEIVAGRPGHPGQIACRKIQTTYLSYIEYKRHSI